MVELINQDEGSQSQMAKPTQPKPKFQKPQLSDYQKTLLEELKKNPEVMKLLNCVFGDYPKMIIEEFKLSSPNATKRQKEKGREVSMYKMRLESFIEGEIVKLAGIDVDSIINKEVKETVEKSAKELQKDI